LEVGFRDGSLWQVAKVTDAGAGTQFRLVCGAEFTLANDLLTSDVTWLRPRGQRVTYLSDLPSVGYKHIPLLELPWPLQRDRNVLGGQLRCGGRICTKGLGLHSTSRVAYEVREGDRRFQAEAALDEHAGLRGSVTFRVLLEDTQGQWQRAYESPVVRGATDPLPISVDVRGVRRLALIVDFADGGDVLDHANWLNARFVR
jgi:hypothetical protein